MSDISATVGKSNSTTANINLNTCSKKGKAKFDKKLNNELKKLQQVEKPLMLSQNKITKINDKLSDIINERGPTGVINSLANALNVGFLPSMFLVTVS